MNIFKFLLSLIDPATNDQISGFEKVKVADEKRVWLIKPKLKVTYKK